MISCVEYQMRLLTNLNSLTASSRYDDAKICSTAIRSNLWITSDLVLCGRGTRNVLAM